MDAYVASLKNFYSSLPSLDYRKELFSIGGHFARYACPLGRQGSFSLDGREFPVADGCYWPTQDSSSEQADIAVVWSGTWDVSGRKNETLFGKDWKDLTDTNYRSWLFDEYNSLLNHLRTKHGVKFIAIVNYLGQSHSSYQNSYTAFLSTVTQQNDVALIDLVDYLKDKNAYDFLIDGAHVSIGEPTDYSFGNDNSGADLYRKWFEPALCQAVQQKAPELLPSVICPEIDHSPRVK